MGFYAQPKTRCTDWSAMNQTVRAWIYRIVAVAAMVAVVLGLITEEQLVSLAALVTAITNSLAAINTPTNSA